MDLLEAELEKWRSRENWVQHYSHDMLVIEGQKCGEYGGYDILHNPFLPPNTWFKYDQFKVYAVPTIACGIKLIRGELEPLSE